MSGPLNSSRQAGGWLGCTRVGIESSLFAILWPLFGLAASACPSRPQAVISTHKGAATVNVEIAATRPKRTLGLMYRDDLGADEGMLFIFPQTKDHQFWMKNTKLGLDILFISERLEVLAVIEQAQPFSTRALSVGRPSRFVLEVRAGFSAAHGVRAGDRVTFRGFDLAAVEVEPE